MTEQEFKSLLIDALETHNELNEEDGEEAAFSKITDFKDAQVLTTDEGLVVKAHDGSEFQIAIVRSK